MFPGRLLTFIYKGLGAVIHFYTANLTLRTVGAGHARPATYPIPQLVANAQQIPNMHLAQKFLSKFVEKIKSNP